METEQKDHSDFYKHVSTLGLVTFAGSVTLVAAMPPEYAWWLLIAVYLALASTILSLRAMKIILSEGRIPHASKGAALGGKLTGSFNLYAPYSFLIYSLVLIALLIAFVASGTLGSRLRNTPIDAVQEVAE